MAEGRSNQGIADAPGDHPAGVEKHVSSIFGKLGLPGGSESRRVLAVLLFLRS